MFMVHGGDRLLRHFCVLRQPVLEACRAQLGAVARDEAAFGECRPEVASVGIADHLARVVTSGEALPDEVVEAELLRAGDLDEPVERLALGRPAHRGSDVVGGDGLEQDRRQADDVAVGGLVGDPAEELENCVA